jgi:uroporphyrinogen decarboxylase
LNPVAEIEKPFLRALAGQGNAVPPIWLMRQAGRYLPEYRELRGRAGDFLDICLSPDVATELTLQPIRRFGFDAAILFSDILVLPHALGRPVRFEEGVGPIVGALAGPAEIADLATGGLGKRLAPVYEAVRCLRAELPAATALIGFAGAPWTVASYMIEGGSSKDFAKAKAWAYGDPGSFQRLIDVLVETTADHLIGQVDAGAEALQLFDSWAGVWPEAALRRWCLDPATAIRRRVRQAYPDIPMILFPRGAGILYRDFAEACGAEALSLDTTVPLAWARDQVQSRVTVQGNLDPIALLAGGGAQQTATAEILDALAPGPFVFNLGHGILPQTPLAHVQALVEQVRAWRPRA